MTTADSKFDILQEISEYVHDIDALLPQDDQDGNYLHEEIQLTASTDVLQQIADELKLYRDQFKSPPAL